MELLGRAGPDGFSASALARETGVSKATIFHHFDSLDEIPLEALEGLFIAAMAGTDDPELDLFEYLQTLKDDALEMIQTQRRFFNAYFVFLTKALFDPRVRERFSVGAFMMHDTLSAALEPRMPPGTPPEEADEIARLVGAVLDGISMHYMVMDDHDRLDRAWGRFMDLLKARYGQKPVPGSKFRQD